MIVTTIAFFIADKFTVVGLGEDIATNVGVNYQRIMLVGISIVAAISGVVAVVVGSLPSTLPFSLSSPVSSTPAP